MRRVAILAILACLVAALGGLSAAPSVAQVAQPPPDSSFQKVTLEDSPGEPMDLAVLPDLRVLHTTRDGQVRLHDPRTGLNSVAARLDVYKHDEEGLQSIAIDANFMSNKWVYLYYQPPLNTPVDDPSTPNVNEGNAPEFGTAADFAPFKGISQLSRFKLKGNTLDLASEQKIIDVPADRGICCHMGGQIDFDGQGNLYLSTGDDTNPFQSDGYTPIDERPDRNPAFDAQRTSANTNDLRGKLLRIRVKSGGGYTVPAGNLFSPGTANTKPEIYAMGFRNPFRFAVNRENGDIYLADYSPDNPQPDPLRGPAGHGKWTVLREPGNYGWPYCATAELPYVDYDFATMTSTGVAFDCANPVNESPNNTGLVDLPPTEQPQVWYPSSLSPEFPELGTGGVGPMGGPAYDFDRKSRSPNRWPEYYDGVPLFFEWTRDYVKEFRLDQAGNLAQIIPVLPTIIFDNPMSIEFGPDGALYVLEYGDGFFLETPEAQLARIDFVRGGRTPVPVVSATPTNGAVPLTVRFSSAGTSDPDGDTLKYAWDFDADGHVDSTQPNPTFTYEENGLFDATLKVTDPSGRSASASVQIIVGNTAPVVELTTSPAPGEPFAFGQTVTFQVTVTDPEDDPIDCSRVSVTYILGHEQHGHPLSTTAGCTGSIETFLDPGHAGAGNLSAVFVAQYTDLGGPGVPSLTGSDEVRLIPNP
jgi:cytochrome c